MLGLFAKKLPVSGEELEWLLACFAWAAESLGGFDRRFPDLAAAIAGIDLTEWA